MTETKVERIDMSQTPDLDQAIIDMCTLAGEDFELSSSFVFDNQIILVFQSIEVWARLRARLWGKQRR